MSIVLVLVCVLWLLYISTSIKISRIKRIIGQIFCVEWLVIMILSACNLYNIYKVSYRVILCILVHVCFFMLGYVLSFKANFAVDVDKNEIRNKKIYHSIFMNIIAWIALVPLFIVFLRYVAYAGEVGVGTARVAIFSAGTIFHSATECQLYLYFGYTYFFIFSTILIYGIYTKELFRSWISFPVISGILLYLVTGAGRLDYIVLGCEFFVILVAKKENKLVKGQKKKIVFGIIALLLVIVIVTGKRFGINKIEMSNIKELFSLAFSQIYIYAVGPLRAFDYALENYVEILGFNLGRMTFGAFDELLGWCCTLLGIPYDIMNFYYGGITQDTIFIGENHGFNALYTALFHFYFDFGWVGVALFSFMFGLVLNYTIKRLEFRCSMPNIIILCLMFFVMLMMPISWKMSAPAMLIIIGICICWEKFRVRIG